eukprot:67446-Pelagomonas_calceolata.AAC.4
MGHIVSLTIQTAHAKIIQILYALSHRIQTLLGARIAYADHQVMDHVKKYKCGEKGTLFTTLACGWSFYEEIDTCNAWPSLIQHQQSVGIGQLSIAPAGHGLDSMLSCYYLRQLLTASAPLDRHSIYIQHSKDS